MTIDHIQRRLDLAADDRFAPPTRVVGLEVYRIGLRRRRARRWFSVAAVSVTVIGVAGATAALAEARTGSGHLTVLPGPAAGRAPAATGSAAPIVPSLDAGSPPDVMGCAELAAAVSAAVAAALPKDLAWRDRSATGGDATCAGRGNVWFTFIRDGQEYRLSFAGGTGSSERGCDPVRRPTRCERIPGGEVGHLSSDGELGVTLSRSRGGVYFALWVTGHSERSRPLTTRQLSAAARRVAAEVFP